jgi:hypothetical protein
MKTPTIKTQSLEPKDCFIGRKCGKACVSKKDKCRDTSELTLTLAQKLVAKGKTIGATTPTLPPEAKLQAMLKVLDSPNSLLAMAAGSKPHPYYKNANVSEFVVQTLSYDLLTDQLTAKLLIKQGGRDFFTGTMLKFSDVVMIEVGDLVTEPVLVSTETADWIGGLNKEQAAKATHIAIKWLNSNI